MDRKQAYNFEDIANNFEDIAAWPGTALAEVSDAPSLDLNDAERGHMPGNLDNADLSDSLVVLTTDYDAVLI